MAYLGQNAAVGSIAIAISGGSERGGRRACAQGGRRIEPDTVQVPIDLKEDGDTGPAHSPAKVSCNHTEKM